MLKYKALTVTLFGSFRFTIIGIKLYSAFNPHHLYQQYSTFNHRQHSNVFSIQPSSALSVPSSSSPASISSLKSLLPSVYQYINISVYISIYQYISVFISIYQYISPTGKRVRPIKLFLAFAVKIFITKSSVSCFAHPLET